MYCFDFSDSIIISPNKVLFGDSAEGLSLPEELHPPAPHAHTFNDFLNVTECQAEG